MLDFDCEFWVIITTRKHSHSLYENAIVKSCWMANWLWIPLVEFSELLQGTRNRFKNQTNNFKTHITLLSQSPNNKFMKNHLLRSLISKWYENTFLESSDDFDNIFWLKCKWRFAIKWKPPFLMLTTSTNYSLRRPYWIVTVNSYTCRGVIIGASTHQLLKRGNRPARQTLNGAKYLIGHL